MFRVMAKCFCPTVQFGACRPVKIAMSTDYIQIPVCSKIGFLPRSHVAAV